MESKRMEEPYFTFGIIADIQYADMDNRFNYLKTSMRYYRNSLTQLKAAVEEWAMESIKPAFILQLGDIIDGINTKDKSSKTALERVLVEMDKLPIQFHHVWGNHEFYNFSREYLNGSKLNSQARGDRIDRGGGTSENGEFNDESFYAYHFSPCPKFRFLLIDGYDLSPIGREKTSPKYDIALNLLKEKNPNEDLNSPTGLEEVQFVLFNGGISPSQLDWMERVLTSSDEKEENVFVVSHLPVHPDAADPMCLVWNYPEVLSVLQSHPCVVGYLAGHNHEGRYCMDPYGIHHLTFSGVIETPPESRAFGTMPSRRMSRKHRQKLLVKMPATQETKGVQH
uniref:Manganese-dependent ADP-ribose/CDP-alcohol diphosphatase n=1 Tax=Xenopus tropicalis TaxID=8364 RepID=A0A803JZD2_XENTR